MRSGQPGINASEYKRFPLFITSLKEQEKIDKTKLSKEAKEKAVAELKKLKSMSPMSAESAVVRNYLDWLLTIPWRKKSRIKSDLNHAQEILDNDHFGLIMVILAEITVILVLKKGHFGCTKLADVGKKI